MLSKFLTLVIAPGFSLLFVSVLTNGVFPSQAAAEPPQQNGPKYLLQYKLKAGESLVSKVSHFAETRTTMAGQVEASSSRTISEKVWQVTEVAPNGDMTFVYQINSVNLAQSVGDAEEVKYNSEVDEEVPEIFKNVASTLATPLATVTINPRGQVLDRDKELKTPQLGMGELTIPLPDEPIAINSEWAVPRDMRVKLESGGFKAIKVRELYTLTKVSAGVATIRIETQPLTPIDDRSVEAQLIQQLSRGEIKFDIDHGRMLAKKLDWSDEVVDFAGADTSLRYDAKFVEELLPEASRTASRPTANSQ